MTTTETMTKEEYVDRFVKQALALFPTERRTDELRELVEGEARASWALPELRNSMTPEDSAEDALSYWTD